MTKLLLIWAIVSGTIFAADGGGMWASKFECNRNASITVPAP